MPKIANACSIIVLAAMLLGGAALMAQEVTPLEIPDGLVRPNTPAPGLVQGGDGTDYTGTLRIFIVEPVSRWDDRGGDPYRFGLLDIAAADAISVGSTAWEQTYSWDGDNHGYGNITSGNIAVIAVIFNSVGEVKDAVPPYGYYYTSYPADAAALATPGSPGQNTTSPGFTHTVFAEEGTVTT